MTIYIIMQFSSVWNTDLIFAAYSTYKDAQGAMENMGLENGRILATTLVK